MDESEQILYDQEDFKAWVYARATTVFTISSTLAIAPIPFSPHTSTFSIGSMTRIPISPLRACNCRAVIGLSYIIVFIAGHTTMGFTSFPFSPLLLKSQQRTTRDRVLSQIPFTVLARVLAESGAMRRMSAHFLNSICRTSSLLSLHFHSS